MTNNQLVQFAINTEFKEVFGKVINEGFEITSNNNTIIVNKNELEMLKELLVLEINFQNESNETFGITRTGNKMLTLDEEIAMGYSVTPKLISSLVTKNDKNKDIMIKLLSTGAFHYYELKDGERYGKEYFLNTSDLKYVYEDNKRYKAKLPKWITKEQLLAMY